MASEKDNSLLKSDLSLFIRSLITVRNLVMLFAGILAGYSISVLGKDIVVIPLIGSFPGPLFGIVGVAIAIGVYYWGSDCDNCREKECGCGESCSHEPDL